MKVKLTEYGHTSFEQITRPWPGCGFEAKNTRLDVRRVMRNGREESHIEILIHEIRKGKTRLALSSFVMPVEIAEQFVKALTVATDTTTSQLVDGAQ